MTRSLKLDDFTSAADPEPAKPTPEAALRKQAEDVLEAFDRGYKNGWDDCAIAEAEERRSVGADLAKHLAEAGLTYETARRDLLSALAPLFDEIVATLLPRMAAEAVAPVVIAELDAIADAALAAEVELHAAPSACPVLKRITEDHGIENLKIRPEPAFAEGQASIRLGVERRDLDMTEAADRIAEAIRGYRAEIDLETDEAPMQTKGVA